MERIDSRGCDYEMDRDLTIDIMQKILHSFDGRVGEDIIISSCIYEFGQKHEPTIKLLTNLIGEQLWKHLESKKSLQVMPI